jgi:hypothetical protein
MGRTTERREETMSGAKAEATTHINKQVLPQAPSPTMTSFLRISAMVKDGCDGEGDELRRRRRRA